MGGKPSHEKAPDSGGSDGEWEVYTNLDMCMQGDVEIIGNWKKTHTIDSLKAIVQRKGYSAFTVSNGSPSFGHAALKSFDFDLTKAHLRPISTCCRHPCKIYIWKGKPRANAAAQAQPKGDAGGLSLSGHYLSFARGGSPANVVDRFEARQNGSTVTFYRNGPVGTTSKVNSSTARPMESYHIDGRTLRGPVTATVEASGDISWSHGYTSRKEGAPAPPPAHPEARAFSLGGFVGYNSRLNGEYTCQGDSANGRPVYSHMHREGVGGGHDWCRMWWSHGAWRIGHHAWTHGDSELAVAYVSSDAKFPTAIEGDAVWREHKGTRCGADFGKAASQFKLASAVHVKGGNGNGKGHAGGGGSEPVVVGSVVGSADVPLVIADAVAVGAVGASASATPPLIKLVETFERELGLNKGMAVQETVDAAVKTLGLKGEVGEAALMEKAARCWEVLGRPL